MRVLVAAPIYDNMRYCMKEFLDSLKNLDYGDYDILIIDNSRTEGLYNELKEDKRLIVLKDDTKEEKNLSRLVSSRNKILDYAKEKGYEYLLMMDSDVIAPKDTIKKLMAWGKDLVSGLYYNYFNVEKEVRWMPIAWMLLTEEEFREIKENYGLPSIIKSRFDLRRHMTEEEASSGNLLEVLYPSAGCLLFSKKAISEARYGLKETGKIHTGDDIYMIDEMRKKGFSVYVDTSVKCKHLVLGKFEKDKEGNLIHPLGR